ncbi:MAG: hypothetical protein JNJ80_15430 [Gemmatimonadetes bacterium]|nr:hypothetical protein [Gemmatimonadota bacterium]
MLRSAAARRLALHCVVAGVAACSAPPRDTPPAAGTDGAQPGMATLIVSGNEYAFQVADTVDPGPTVIQLDNRGKVFHEMVVMKLRPATTIASLLQADAADASFQPFLEGGSAVLFAAPGATGTGRLAVTFEPGARYALWCNFSDSPGAPKHSALGMVREIVVRQNPRTPRPAAAPVRTVAVELGDYAFRTPDTVSAGWVEVRVSNLGRQRHELALSRLKNGEDGAFFYSQALKNASLDSLYDDDGVILTAYPGGDNPFAIRVELLPGRVYVLECLFKDSDSSPPHNKLGMFKALTVRPPT